MNGLLVFSRKVQEEICIGKDIRIMVIRAERGRAKIAIQAPRIVEVDRREIWERKFGPRPDLIPSAMMAPM